LIRPDAWREMDLFRVVREKRATLLLAHLILSAFQRRLGERLGVKPGGEMLAAIDAAQQTGAELVLADREIQVTLRRTWGALRWWEKWRLAFQLTAMLVAPPELTESEVESLKGQDMLTQVMDEFARAFPRAKATLIDERDHYLAQRIRTAPGETIVAVVGAGHLAGILERLRAPAGDPDLSPLTRLPRASWSARAIQWAIPALVLGLLGYGFLTADAQVSWEMIKVWFLATGLLAGLGAALVLAHPLSILTAVVAAPFTTLHPLLAAGWFAGLTEAMVHKPRVRDFEALPTDLMSFRGFWRNGVTRVLLVVALANLGATIGTFLGIPLVVRLLP
jgi:pheromone shutdown-related protein TraB